MGKVLGTAATEADQWENVTRSLEESQRLLNAALGEAAIELIDSSYSRNNKSNSSINSLV